MELRELLINPTLQCAPPLELKSVLDTLEKVGNRMVHIDVMDGHYVPNLAMNLDQVRAIREQYAFLLDVHLMVKNPSDYISTLCAMGVDYISFHTDATSFSVRFLHQIREKGISAGIAINPSQSVDSLKEILPFTDYVIVMGVEPGFSGQKFIESTLDKIRDLRDFREKHKLSYLIEVDGGLNDQNSIQCVKMGADILVSGAFGVFRNEKGLQEDYMDVKAHLEKNLNS